MDSKKADNCARGEDEDKRTCDFHTLLLLNLKKRLYDRLKQGCLCLVYRPNKDLMLQKHITHVEDDGTSSQAVESSELSTITDRTNSVRSDVFYSCDGQWRSNDWHTIGACTVTNRSKSMTVVRRRRVQRSSVGTVDDEFEASVSTISEFSIVQSILPWFFPWILTVLIFFLTQNPKSHQLRKRRKERNLKVVRSMEYRSRSRQKTIGMRPIVPSRVSNMLMVARSMAKQTTKATADASGETKIVDHQCAAVARMHTLPVNGMPPCPRLITTPPSSPRIMSPKATSPSYVPSTSPKGISISTEENINDADHQPFRILSQNSEKIVIEVETKGLLSKHFSESGSSFDASSDSAVDATETIEEDGVMGVANCEGRSMEHGTSEDIGRSPQNFSKPIENRRAKTIRLLKERKAREWAEARSRESSGSLDFTKTSPRSVGKIESQSNIKSDVEVERTSTSVGHSPTHDVLNGDPLSRNSSCTPLRFDSGISVSTETSEGTIASGVPSLSHQTMELMRRNSRVLTRDVVGSFSSTLSRCSSISEEEDDDDLMVVRSQDSKMHRQKSDGERQAQMAKLQELFHPQMNDSAPRQTTSPFLNDSRQFQDPKPQRPQLSTSPPAVPKPVLTESVTEPRSPPKTKKPPPPPPPAAKEKEKTTTGRTINKPPPPSKTRSGKKTAAPPPPPPGGRKGKGKDCKIIRSSKVIEMFQYVNNGKKRGGHRRTKTHQDAPSSKSLQSEGSGGLIKELEKNSRHIAQIQSDVETHRTAINNMIVDINARKFDSMSEMNTFVKRVDDFLDRFADETAVLKHFEWPHRYYVYREALALWSEFKNRTEKCRNWPQGTRGISAELHKMKKTMEMNIRRMDDVQRTLEAEVKKFIRNGIPWDSSVIDKVHDGTMCLLEKYMQIVYDEVSRNQTKSTQKEKNLQYLTDTINLTFKIHQCVGGLTESCSTLFEKIAAFTHTFNTDH